MFAPHSRHEVGREVGFSFQDFSKSIVPRSISACNKRSEKLGSEPVRTVELTNLGLESLFLDLKLRLKVEVETE